MTPSSKKKLSLSKRIALLLERVYKSFHRTISNLTGYSRHPMTCEIFHVIRHHQGITAKGRVMRIRKIRRPKPKDGFIRNFWEMLKVWATPERPFTTVLITCDSCEQQEVISDAEGYFEVTLPTRNPNAEITFEIPISENSPPIAIKPLPVSDAPRCLIVSDIDDTVLITNAARTLSMIATTLFGNAFTRQIFPGTSELYRGLQRGPLPDNKSQRNPISYVTSSPYNLKALLSLIFKTNEIPLGAFFMTDWGLDEHKWLKLSHSDHKLTSIRKSLEWYPEKPAILIGDSGQHDSHIYSQIVSEFPGRISHVLIRCVSDEVRIQQLKEDWQQIDTAGVEVTFFKDCREAAKPLFQQGWIDERTLSEVEAAFSKQQG